MTTRKSASPFDEYSLSYDKALQKGLAISGERKEYFAERRIAWLAAVLDRLNARVPAIMDFGCGPGDTSHLLLELPAAATVIGVDESEGLLDVARRSSSSPRVSFATLPEYSVSAAIDLVYCNGVFHHIPPAQRAETAAWIRDRLRPGGFFALWENNPLSPATRYVMSRIPFDKDAMLLSPRSAARLLEDAGLEVVRTEYLFLLPRWLAPLRVLERWLGWFPLGAQYLVLGRKPGV